MFHYSELLETHVDAGFPWCQRSRRQPDHSRSGHSSSLPSCLPGAGRHVVQGGPEPSRHHGSLQDVQQHGPTACGAGEELRHLGPALAPPSGGGLTYFTLTLPSFFSGLQIRVPAFLDLFMQSLFKPGSKINQDHKYKYIHILAYAASVVETWKKVHKDEKTN